MGVQEAFTDASGWKFVGAENFRPLPLEFLEHQAGILTAEAEAVGEGGPDVLHPGYIGHVVQVAIGVGEFVVYGGVNHTFSNRFDASDGFHSPRAPQQMPYHGFGGAYGHAVGVITEDLFYRQGLYGVVEFR